MITFLVARDIIRPGLGGSGLGRVPVALRVLGVVLRDDLVVLGLVLARHLHCLTEQRGMRGIRISADQLTSTIWLALADWFESGEVVPSSHKRADTTRLAISAQYLVDSYAGFRCRTRRKPRRHKIVPYRLVWQLTAYKARKMIAGRRAA